MILALNPAPIWIYKQQCKILDVGNFIDLLRTKQVISAMGATFLPESVGNLDLPRRTAAATGYWVADSNAATASAQAIA